MKTVFQGVAIIGLILDGPFMPYALIFLAVAVVLGFYARAGSTCGGFAMKQKVLGLAGWSGSGKTTFAVQLITRIKGTGLNHQHPQAWSSWF